MFLMLFAAGLMLWGCAQERARTDIALEMTDEDSVEAIIDQDLLTVGGTIISIEEQADTRGRAATVTYVDETEMKKPVLIEPDESLKPEAPEAAKPAGERAAITEPGLIHLEEPLVTPTEEKPAEEAPVIAEEDREALFAEAEMPALPSEEAEIPVEEADEAEAPPSEEPTAVTEVSEETTVVAQIPAKPEIGMGTEPAVVRPPRGGYYATYRTTRLPVAYPRHTVVRGDTLWSISRKHGCTISELAAANSVSRRSILRIGQILLIPVPKPEVEKEPATEIAEEPAPSPDVEPTADEGAAMEEEKPPEPSLPPPPPIETDYYTVQSGDSYWKIAKRYGITSAELMALNDTSDTLIRIGQKILVPKE